MSTQIDTEPSPYYAAVDLGSNSFHMLIARVSGSSVEIIDREKEMVQIARGLNALGSIDPDAQQRALACLTRFAERLRGIPARNIRAVGTKTLRSASSPRAFLRAAEKALGCPIQIISGYEEARLVYAGLAHSVINNDQRLVIDIGGGSTEFIIGKNDTPLLLESLGLGCVTFTESYFTKNGGATARAMHKAYVAASNELEEIRQSYLKKGWHTAYGTSGTMKAIAELTANEDGGAIISKTALDKLAEEIVQRGEVQAVSLPDLRRQVLPAGVAILQAVFNALKLEKIHVADATLKDGLIYDTLGRLSNKDSRDAAVRNLINKHTIDEEQARRVAQAAVIFWKQIKSPELPGISRTKILRWAAQLHEVGLSISHSSYHHHGFYILHNSDLAGFGRYEQYILANLVRFHRRALDASLFQGMDETAIHAIIPMLLCLRLAVLLHRRREDLNALPKLSQQAQRFVLTFEKNWLNQNPLTLATLEDEQKQFKQLGLELEFS